MKSKYHMTSVNVSEQSELSETYTRIKRSKENESGRSMVEMLGVLALMGVLAIGGIMGYRWAMTKYQANETFNELRRRVVVHSQQSIVGSPLTQVELGDKTQLGYPITVTGIEGGFFELTLTGVENDLCREMVRTGWILPIQTRVNGVVSGTNEELCGETNELVFRFQTEMGGCKTDSDCLCGTCTNGKCVSTCGSGESCVKNFDDGQYVCCPSGNINGSFCCEMVNEKGECCDSDGKCCPPDKPLMDANGKCWACDDPMESINMGWGDKEEYYQRCSRCSNRTAPRVIANEIVFCSLPCPDGKIRARDVCRDCSDDVDFIAAHSECLKCPNRFIASWVGVDRGCYRCDTPDPIASMNGWTNETRATCEKNCPNRRFVTGWDNWKFCALRCGEGEVMNNDAECVNCRTTGYFYARHFEEECARCEGHFLGTGNESGVGGYQSWGCHRCDSEQQSIYLGEVSYNSAEVNAWAKESCEACGNRGVIGGQYRYCAKYCTDGQIWDNVGQCHTCGEPQDFSVKGVPEDKCACPGVRYLDGDICKKCPSAENADKLTEVQCLSCGLTWQDNRCGE